MKRPLLICLIGIALLGLGCLGFPALCEGVVDLAERLAAEYRGRQVPRWRGVTSKIVDGPVPGAKIESVLITVRGKPEVRKDEYLSYLVFPPYEGREVEVGFEAEEPWYKALPKDRILEFMIWQTKRVSSHKVEVTDWEYKGVLSKTQRIVENWHWYSEIETIRDGGKLLFDARICPVHNSKMERGEIEICYGLPSREFLEFMRKAPFAGFTLGGCCVGAQNKEIGYRCSECVLAYKTWQAEEAERRRPKK